MYQDRVTIFNRVGNTWQAKPLSGVDLNVDRMAVLATYGASSGDSAKLHIKYNGDNVGDYIYKEPKQFTGGAEITFRSGEEFDFFMEGIWDGDAVVDDTAYIDGFYNYMNANYDNVFAISSVAKYSVIPHFEIMGR